MQVDAVHRWLSSWWCSDQYTCFIATWVVHCHAIVDWLPTPVDLIDCGRRPYTFADDHRHSQPKFIILPRCIECRRGLAMRKLSVRLSVRPSVKRVHCDKTKERTFQIFIQYERSFSLVFWEEEWLVGGDRFYLNFWVNRPHWSKIADFKQIFHRSASALTPSEKSPINNTNKKSTTRFPMSISDHRTLAQNTKRPISV